MKRVIIDANTLASGSVNPHPEAATSLIYHELTGTRIAKVEFIVTGDKHLLGHIGLEPPAVNARNACELLGLIELR